MNPENLKLILGILAAGAAIIGGLYGVVTIPILRTIKAEISASESRVRTDMISMESRLEKQMIEMEARLNQRIDTRLVLR